LIWPDLTLGGETPIFKKHITFCQKISSHMCGLINSIQIVLKYRKTYRNYLNVLIHILRKEYPAKAFLRNGNQIILNSFVQSYNIAELQGHKEVQYDIMSDTVMVPGLRFTQNSNLKLKLHGGLYNGEIVNIFLEDLYRTFPVEGKIVIDIGANIGDSCIYFALRGAERVIGVEPFPKNYEMAKKNIELNNFSNTITVVLAGCGAKQGYIDIDTGLEKGIASKICEGSKRDTAIPLLTLEYILEQNKFAQRETVLKMDCEGCEYDIVLSSPDDILRRFSHILIEYHYGNNDLKEKLEKCNFDVSLIKLSGKPGGATAVPDPERLGHWYYMGYIYAKRKCDKTNCLRLAQFW
jgi:FkbM family methyltransferase